MRLWHYDLLRFLPRGQLLAQWRELNSIFAKQDQHVLINYVYAYDKKHLYVYSRAVMQEMQQRGYRIRSFDKMNAYFDGADLEDLPEQVFPEHHNHEYVLICYYNLYEKFLRGQQDYSAEQFALLKHYVQGLQAA
ncbi:pyrimidine dimer DNA glycosylase/endonuclease V [Vitreoscilla massiliensis]|uniref:Pyrimidine dimer DNA glycosylase/endonuclease V n=1 Tax=Vitreoscilla massiliensis TaxID=1689272 RepID=A0ABY4E616_9NEIS|nr:pyrimidine dimer DNA glycosylase/endonuclease V [Vitreoscilla massiliensis]UOO90724.1 pyrimidine dimer DNA glycosylase/endonuclease V [Vitreoscilla massiliensis]